ncbi:hypothetical protein HD554DRAFT_2105406, partial [Boletus coccyginus]
RAQAIYSCSRGHRLRRVDQRALFFYVAAAVCDYLFYHSPQRQGLTVIAVVMILGVYASVS